MLLGAAVLLLIVASLRDIATRIVPNFIPLALAAVGIALSAVQGRLPWGIATGALVFAFAFLCWRKALDRRRRREDAGAAAILIPPAVGGKLRARDLARRRAARA